MSRFILFTKTKWDEPPRLRHQFAQLLASAGHDVLFFEKPSTFGAIELAPRARERGITTVASRELMHHKLRLSPTLHRANAVVTKRSIRDRLSAWGGAQDTDTVISFNYDYWFLRDLFPRNRLITVINDDFICVALFGYTKPLLWAMQRTCSASDRVLTVSAPLQQQLSQFTTPELFLPWADIPYRAPAAGRQRDLLLFWGYTNRRIDFAAVRALADRLARTRPEVRILFVGPIGPVVENVEADVATLRERPNIEFRDSTALDALPMDRVLAAYIPYRPHDLEVNAITLSNKGLQLLARGLPLLVSALPALPNFLQAPFVFRVNADDPATQVDELRRSFDRLQSDIAAFVQGNGPDARLAQLLGR